MISNQKSDAKYKKNFPVKVSIVVPIYNVSEYLERTVANYEKQVFQNFEIILVNDGSTDNSLEIAQKLAEEYDNIVVLNKTNGGLSSARNAGVEVVRGEYIFFVDPDDTLEVNALEKLVATIEETGSDIAIAGYDLQYGEQLQKPGQWMQKLFEKSLRKVQIEDHPELLQAATAWSKLFRSSFYRDNNLTFVPGILYEDQPFTSKAYSLAKNGIDLVSGYYYHWLQRDESISHQVTTHDLQARINSAELTLANFTKESEEYQARLVQYLNHDLISSLRHFGLINDEFDLILQEKLTWFYNQLSDKTLLSPQATVAYDYLVRNELEILQKFISETNISVHKAKLVNVQGKAHVDYTSFNYVDPMLGVSNNEVLDEEFSPVARLYSWRTDTDSESIVLDVQAYIRKLDRSQFDYKLFADIVAINERTGAEGKVLDTVQLTQSAIKPAFTRDGKEWWFNAGDTFYELRIPTQQFSYNTAFKIKLTIQAGVYEHSMDLVDLRENTNINYNYLNVSDRNQIRRKSSSSNAFYLKKVPIATVTNISQNDGDLVLDVVSGAPLVEAELYAKANDKLHRRATLQTTETGYQLTVKVDDIVESTILSTTNFIGGNKSYNLFGLRLYNNNGNAILPVLQSEVPVKLDGISLRNNKESNMDIILSRTITVSDLEVLQNKLRLNVQLSNSIFDQNKLIVRLSNASKTVEYQYIVTNNSTDIIDVPLTYDEFGAQKLLPLGRYKIALWIDSSDDTFVSQAETFTVSETYVRSLPVDVYDGEYHSVRVEYQTRDNRLYMSLFNNILDDDKGGYGWGRLLTNYKQSTQQVDQSKVLMISYMGDVIDDDFTRMNAFLVENKQYGKTTYWAVKDRTYAAPNGAVPVIIGSREWFDLLATAGYIFFNVHQNIYVDKKPGQTFVQFFHGYPFKGMGSLYYEEMEYTEKQKFDFARREAEWDYVVSPAPYATPLYEKYFNLSDHVKMIQVGYPRNDDLVNERLDSDQAFSNNIRERLDIPHNKKIILYAPTFREYVLTRDDIINVKGKEIHVLNLDHLAQDLGDDYVILARGHHSYNRGTRKSQDAHRVIDVTAYPDINDLIRVSDAAILDYSSLRFDYAQTLKPAIFYTPDYAQYFGKRSGLMPYEETIFGPMAMEYSELVTRLRTINDWIHDYQTAYNQFIQEYTPLEDGGSAERISDIIFGETDELVYQPQNVEEQSIIWTPPVRKDISKFIDKTPDNGVVRVLKTQRLYNNVVFEEKYQTEEYVKENQVVSVDAISWTNGGTPRLKLKNGRYLSSNKKNVAKVRSDIDNYFVDITGKQVSLLKKQSLYTDVNFTSDTKTTDTFEVGAVVEVQGIAWTKGGTPRLIVENGYISANKENVKVVE